MLSSSALLLPISHSPTRLMMMMMGTRGRRRKRRNRGIEAAGSMEEEVDKGFEGGGRKAKLVARRKERIRLPGKSKEPALSMAQFLRHPSGVEAILNSRALHCFQPLDSRTYRCTLHQLQFLSFHVSPVIDLRVTPTSHDCTVEMLSCKFEGSKAFEQQNQLFSAFMKNYMTWDENCPEPCLDVDVSLNVALEVYTKPFSLLPISAVEKPGNLLMQGLLDRLTPLLAKQLLEDYHTWIEEQLRFHSKG
ncbi:uncharacterized protein LOC120256620 [Dioscorea cayenensis subsp. rotundata]|uniref:Uncharacterized protein LOC120256620 n=1 Tax=Dioscorea cayennensis subsp. rotundata TaxID=55577 RepID=A0AB40AYY8_DIOCR|nr:uncharacterized protein LOC120256620 [Dioscorea cayenensis subsp. rotundata]